MILSAVVCSVMAVGFFDAAAKVRRAVAPAVAALASRRCRPASPPRLLPVYRPTPPRLCSL